MGDEWPAKLLEQQIQSIEDFIEGLIEQKAELEFQIEELSKVKNALLTVLGVIVERTLLASASDPKAVAQHSEEDEFEEET